MPVLKPVVYIKINGADFHSGSVIGNKTTPIIKFEYKDTDGTSKKNKKKKGERDQLTFSFLDYDPESGSYRSDDRLFKVGNIVSFKFGFEGENQIQDSKLSAERQMKIVSVTSTFPVDGSEIATITCHDFSRDLNLNVQSLFRPKKEAATPDKEENTYLLVDVIKEMAEEDGFKFVPTDKTLDQITQKGGWQQKNETNMQFLQRLAEEKGMNVYVQNKKLFFESIKPATQAPIWGRLYRGMDANFLNATSGTRQALLLDFTPKINLELALKEIETSDVSTSKNEQIKVSSKETRDTYTDVDAETAIDGATYQDIPASKTNATPIEAKSAKDNVTGTQQGAQDSTITASARTLGHPYLVAKSTVRVDGRVSKKWRGKKWYVESVEHNIDTSGYFCSLDLKAPPELGASPNSNKTNADNTKLDTNTETYTRIDDETSDDLNIETDTRNKNGKITTVVKPLPK